MTCFKLEEEVYELPRFRAHKVQPEGASSDADLQEHTLKDTKENECVPEYPPMEIIVVVGGESFYSQCTMAQLELDPFEV